MAKTSVKMIKIHNAETGEVIEREMNAEELAQNLIDEQNDQAMRDALANREALKASAKAKLIAGEPLLPEEAETLVF